MDAPIEKYMGGMYSIHDFNERLEFDGREWIQLGGTFSANMDQWDGEWFAIAKAAITPTFDDVIIPTDNVDFGNVNGSTGNVSFDGIDAVNLDTNILDVTTTANVGTDLDVGGDTGLTGRLDVTGSTTLTGDTTLNNMDHLGETNDGWVKLTEHRWAADCISLNIARAFQVANVPLDIVKLREAELAHGFTAVAFADPADGQTISLGVKRVAMTLHYGKGPLETATPRRTFLVDGGHRNLSEGGDPTSLRAEVVER